jgi:hypothetical protein
MVVFRLFVTNASVYVQIVPCMKPVLNILELLFAIPLGILAAPVLLVLIVVKAFRKPADLSAAVIAMDTSPIASRYAG